MSVLLFPDHSSSVSSAGSTSSKSHPEVQGPKAHFFFILSSLLSALTALMVIPSVLIALITIYISTFSNFIPSTQASLLNSRHIRPRSQTQPAWNSTAVPTQTCPYSLQNELICNVATVIKATSSQTTCNLVLYFIAKGSLQQAWPRPATRTVSNSLIQLSLIPSWGTQNSLSSHYTFREGRAHSWRGILAMHTCSFWEHFLNA